MVNTCISNEEAIKTLNASWTLSHQEHIQAWDQQVTEDEVAQQEQWCLTQEQEYQTWAQQELELENEWQEVKKKKPKMSNFNENAMVNNFIGPPPSAYALQQLAEFEYAELWYFTQEGCANAMHQCTQTEDSFGLSKVNNVVSFRLVSALKASENVLQDSDLTWCQMEIAKTTLIQHITKCEWPKKAITTLAQSFMNLKVHHYHQWAYGEHALLAYQAQVIGDWHNRLKLGGSFNIAIINKTLLQAIHYEIMDKKQAEALDKVSKVLPPE